MPACVVMGMQPPSQIKSTILFTIALLLVLALQCGAAFAPSPGNWGFNFLAFYSRPLQIGALFLVLLLLLPNVRERLFAWLEHAVSWFHRQGRTTRRAEALVGIIAASAMFWIGREQTFFLGDGDLLRKSLPSLKGVTGGIVSENEPFSLFLAHSTWHVLGPAGWIASGTEAYQIVSILSGIAFLIAAVVLARALSAQRNDSALILLFLITGGAMQLFFGYVENYAPFLALLVAFAATSVLTLQGKLPSLVPAIIFGIVVTCHFGALCFLPAYGFLLAREARERRQILRAVASVVATIVTVVAVLLLCGYPLGELSRVLFAGGKHFLPLTSGVGIEEQSILSPAHLINLFNLLMLQSPALPLFLAILVLSPRRKVMDSGAGGMFLLILGVCGFLFSAAVNYELGLSRDWDLASCFTFPLMLAVAQSSLRRIAEEAGGRRWTMAFLVVAALQTLFWIGVNADESRSVRRFTILPDSTYWSARALSMGYDVLGLYYADHANPREAIRWYEESVRRDSSNARKLYNLGQFYREAGMNDQAIEMYERAIRNNLEDEGVYRNLSSLYIRLGRGSDARRVLEAGLRRFPRSPNIVNNYGLALRMTDHDWGKALPYFLDAIALDSGYVQAYYNAGLAYYNLRNYSTSQRYLLRYVAGSGNPNPGGYLGALLDSLERRIPGPRSK